MVQFTSAKTGEAIIATTDKSEILSFSIPKGRNFHLTGVYFASPQKGVGIVECDIFPSLSAEYLFNGDDEDMIGPNNSITPISINCPGPSVVSLSTRQATSTSNTVAAMVQYVDTSGG